MGTANFGIAGMDWQQRVNWERLRKYRLERAREHMKAAGLGAVLCMYDENVRYLTGTLTPGWNRLKPGLRYALLCGDGAPVLFEQGDLGFQIDRHSPWLPKENVRYSYAWIKGAAGPASQQQVKKFTDAIIYEMKRHGVAGQKLGVDFIDINMINIFKEKKINWVDGMTPMMEARAVKNVDEQECMRIVGAIGDATHWECMKFLKPGLTENQVTAHLMKFLYDIPGMEDVEDVIVSSGPNTGPNWRNFSDRIIQPGDIVFMDLAALTWNGYKSCYYRTYCVGKEPSKEQQETYATALEWLYDSIGAVKVGAPTRDLPHLVARPSRRDQGRHDLRARNPARQEVSLWRAHRGDADREEGRDRDRLQFPGKADHRGGPDPRLRRSREVRRLFSLSRLRGRVGEGPFHGRSRGDHWSNLVVSITQTRDMGVGQGPPPRPSPASGGGGSSASGGASGSARGRDHFVV